MSLASLLNSIANRAPGSIESRFNFFSIKISLKKNQLIE